MKERLIIFGAGNYGKSAYKYYGSDSILCFADNNRDKIGKLCFEKSIISFNEMVSICKQDELCMVVIACASPADMCKQLDKEGITKYRCYSPGISQAVEMIRQRAEDKGFGGKVYLCGNGHETNEIYSALKSMFRQSSICGIIKGRYDWDGDLAEGLRYADENRDPTCIVISSATNHHAQNAWLRKRYPKAEVIDPFKQAAYYDTEELIVNPYENNTHEMSEDEWIKKINEENNKKEIREYVETVKNDTPLFEYIEIETINRCNGNCSFCPVNRKADPRKEAIMEESLFRKIIDELAILNYSGELSLFSNNEPLLDNRIVELHKYARSKLPNARIHLFTNGTLLSVELFEGLIPHLDELIIDNYQQELKLIKPVAKIKEYLAEHPELNKKVTIVLRKPNEVLTSRGGDAPNREKKVSYIGETCALPFEQMIIRPDGKVSLCCNDPLGKNTMGDVVTESLVDIWYNENYIAVRNSLAKGREHWKHCEFCDTFYIY